MANSFSENRSPYAPPIGSGEPAQAAPASEVSGAIPIPKVSKNEAKRLKERMLRAESYAKKTYFPLYDRCQKLWRGEHWPDMGRPSRKHRVVVNHIQPIVQTKVDTIAFRPVPEFVIQSLTPDNEGRAQLAAQAVKYEWRRSNAAREAKRCLFDKEAFGIGVCQTGWEFVTDEIAMDDGRLPVEGEPVDPQDLTLAVEEGRDFLEASEPPVAVPKIRRDQFWVRRICPRDFRIDPEATWVIEDAAYLGYVETRPLEDVKDDRRYKNTRQLKGSSANLDAYLSDDAAAAVGDDSPGDCARVKLHHYYEKRRRLHAVFCEEHDLALLVEEWKWKQDRYPFRLIRSAGTEDSFYPEEPPPILLEPMQKEINETRSQLHVHRNRFNRRYQAKRGTADAATKAQLKRGEDGDLIEHNGADINGIVPIMDAPLQQEVYRADQIAHQDIVTVSGIDQYQMGMLPTKRMTTQEVQQVAQSGGARVQADAQEFEEFCAGIAHDCLDWLMQYSLKTQQLPLYGPDEPVQAWGQFSAADIVGDYFVTVYAGSTQVPDQQTQVKDIGFLIQSLLPLLQMPDPVTHGPMFNLKPLVAQMLQNVPGIKDIRDILNPPAPPPPPPMVPGMGGPPGLPPPGGGGPPPGINPLELLAQARAHGAVPPMNGGHP